MPEREYPEQSYYPSAKLRLIPRIDEFGANDIPPPPEKRITARAGTGKDVKSLEVVEEDDALVLRDPNAAEVPGGPQKQESSSDNRTFSIGAIIPRRATWQANGIRTADTLKVMLKYSDLPLDPRTLRSCAVELYVGTVSADEFDRGVAGITRGEAFGPDTAGAGEPLNVVPDTYLDEQNRERSNLRFQGFVDDWEMVLNDSAPMISLTCTDNTRLLIEQEAPPRLTVAANMPIDQAIAEYLSAFPQFRGLRVRYLPAGATRPQLDQVISVTAATPGLGPPPGGGGGSSKTSVWDYLTDVVGMVGHTIRIEGVTIVIQQARALMKNSGTQRLDDPYRPRRLQSGRVLAHRTFIYGRNVTEIRARRNFTKNSAINIEVRCYNGERKKVLIARFPESKDRQTRVNPGEASDQVFQVFRVQGIRDVATLRIIAQGIYEAVGRNELSVIVTTRNVGSFGGSNRDTDVLDMLPGDTVDVQITRDEEIFSTVTGVEDRLAVETRAIEFLTLLGYSEDFAKAYAKAFISVGLQTLMRVRSMRLQWHERDGIDIEFEAVNYITVRADKALTEGEIDVEENDIEPVDVEVE